MTWSWRWAARVAVLATALGAGVAFSGHADAVPPTVAGRASAATTTITAASVSRGAIHVHGLDVATVVVSVTLEDSEFGDPDTVTLTRTTRTTRTTGTTGTTWDQSAPGSLSGPLVRTSGTTGNGTYQGKVRVPSSAHGSWRVSMISFPGLDGPSVDPRDSGVRDATLEVIGTHRPRMRFTLSPRPLPYPQRTLTLSARMSYDDTGRPIAARWIFFEVGCEMDLGRSGQARTDSRGLAMFRTVVQEPLDVGCAWMPFPLRGALTDSSLSYAGDSAFLLFGSRTTGVPSKTSTRRGTPVAVNGRAFAVVPVAGNRVVLKRLVGRHWRTVSVGRVRPSGRFTLQARPPKGLNVYRVALSGSGGLVGSRSRVFVITGR